MKVKYSTRSMAAVIATVAAASAAQADEVMVVWDASNSMRGELDGVAKTDSARQALAAALDNWGDIGADIGLVAYGHRRTGDCSDIQTVLPVGPFDRGSFAAAVDALTPRGMTPLTGALRHAADELALREQSATVILMTDGVETCSADPCAVAAELAAMGVDFRVHVVGFDIGSMADTGQLQCIADATGGQFYTAETAAELGRALASAASAPDGGAPRSEPAAAPAPDPASSTEGGSLADTFAEMTARTREAMAAGETSQSPESGPAPEPQPDPAPDPDPAPETVELAGPDEAVIGSTFRVTWDEALDPRDFVTIVPMDAPDGDYGSYAAVGESVEAQLTAPADPGFYELRYVEDDGRRTVASALIEIIRQDVGLTGPEAVAAGAEFTVSWDGVINQRDFVTVVAMDAVEGDYGSYVSVGANAEGALTAPPEPGFYEIRYVLSEGRRTLASMPIEVTAPDVVLSVPETVAVGDRFPVGWEGAINPRDFVTIVLSGASEGDYGSYANVGELSEATLTAPMGPGLYEIRYVLNSGRRTVASELVEVVAVSADFTPPEGVVVGAPFAVDWSGPARQGDQAAILPEGGSVADAIEVIAVPEAGRELRFAPIEDGGAYDLAYVLGQSGEVIGRVSFEVGVVDASLVAPDVVPSGGVLSVDWTGPGNARDRIAIATPDMGDAQWLQAVPVDGGSPVDLALPETAGDYELRYFDFENRGVIVRRSVRLE